MKSLGMNQDLLYIVCIRKNSVIQSSSKSFYSYMVMSRLIAEISEAKKKKFSVFTAWVDQTA